MSNKVRFGLRNVHYAKITAIASDGEATYSTPKKVPGAVSLLMDPQGEDGDFYADDEAYYSWALNNGYDGTLEIAELTEDFESDILNEVQVAFMSGDPQHDVELGYKGYEMADKQSSHFALLFEFDGDVNHTRHALLNCTAGRPSITSQTTETGKNIQTASVPIKARPIYNSNAGGNAVKVKCTVDGGSENVVTDYKNWFTATEW